MVIKFEISIHYLFKILGFKLASSLGCDKFFITRAVPPSYSETSKSDESTEDLYNLTHEETKKCLDEVLRIKKDFNMMDKHLTFYVKNVGSATSEFAIFNKNWWVRRNESHQYMNYIFSKYRLKYEKSFDFLKKLVYDNPKDENNGWNLVTKNSKLELEI